MAPFFARGRGAGDEGGSNKRSLCAQRCAIQPAHRIEPMNGRTRGAGPARTTACHESAPRTGRAARHSLPVGRRGSTSEISRSRTAFLTPGNNKASATRPAGPSMTTVPPMVPPRGLSDKSARAFNVDIFRPELCRRLRSIKARRYSKRDAKSLGRNSTATGCPFPARSESQATKTRARTIWRGSAFASESISKPSALIRCWGRSSIRLTALAQRHTPGACRPHPHYTSPRTACRR